MAGKKMLRHTPGPWKAGEFADSEFDGDESSGRPIRNRHVVWQHVETEDGKHIATTGIYVQKRFAEPIRISAEEFQANLAWLASAPDLLESLKAMLTFSDLIKDQRPSSDYTLARANAVVAKAMGA